MELVIHKTINVDDERAGDLVAQVLQKDYELICASIRALRSKPRLERYEMEDLANDLDFKDAMKTLLSYYMKHSDYIEFMELQRVYGNE